MDGSELNILGVFFAGSNVCASVDFFGVNKSSIEKYNGRWFLRYSSKNIRSS